MLTDNSCRQAALAKIIKITFSLKNCCYDNNHSMSAILAAFFRAFSGIVFLAKEQQMFLVFIENMALQAQIGKHRRLNGKD